MVLNIENSEVETLVRQVVKLTGESKMEAVRQALIERVERLSNQQIKREKFRTFLQDEVWPHIDPKYLGKGISQEEQDDILGYGKFGV